MTRQDTERTTDGSRSEANTGTDSERSNDGDSMISGDMTEDGADWHRSMCNQHYWRQYLYIDSWMRNCRRKFNSSPSKPDFREWCQLMSSYHATMASHMQWNYLSSVAATPQQFGYNWHSTAFSQNMMQSRVPTSVPSSRFHKKCSRGRKKRKRRSRRRRQSRISSVGDIELHIANIDPDHEGLDVSLGDGSENLEFEFEMTDDLVEFFAETARHRKERGEISLLNVLNSFL